MFILSYLEEIFFYLKRVAKKILVDLTLYKSWDWNYNHPFGVTLWDFRAQFEEKCLGSTRDHSGFVIAIYFGIIPIIMPDNNSVIINVEITKLILLLENMVT